MAANSSRPSFSLADLRSSLPHEQPSFNIVYNMPTINYVQPQQRIIPNFPHPIVAFVIPVILNLIELKCQCKANSPFETNPVTMWFGVSCLLAYSLAYGIELRAAPCLRSPNCSDHSMIRYGSSLFSSLCLASLTSILFPSMKPILYGFFGLLSIGDILQCYKIVWNSIDKSIVINFFRPCRGQVERDLLPV